MYENCHEHGANCCFEVSFPERVGGVLSRATPLSFSETLALIISKLAVQGTLDGFFYLGDIEQDPVSWIQKLLEHFRHNIHQLVYKFCMLHIISQAGK